jgi:hypothetical protein
MRAAHRAALALVALLAVAAPSSALDVSWIPADLDGDGPLPLSAAYRSKLRSLCEFVADPQAAQPPELKAKHAVLRKMCRRLASDDAVGGNGPTHTTQLPFFLTKRGLVTLAIGGGAYAAFQWLQTSKQMRDGTLGGAGLPPRAVGAHEAKALEVGIEAQREALRAARIAKLESHARRMEEWKNTPASDSDSDS